MRTRSFGLALLGVLAVLALLAATTLWAPPPPEAAVRAAVAGRLEAVLPLLDELGVDSWSDRGGCHYVAFTDGGRHQDPAASCGDAAPFDERAQTAWERIAAAATGAVPDGRVRDLLTMDGADDASLGPGRHVMFVAVPRALLGQDALAARWLWTWDEQAAGLGGDGLPAQWRFRANEALF